MTEVERLEARIDSLQHALETQHQLHMLQNERITTTQNMVSTMLATFEQITAGCNEAMESGRQVAEHVTQQAEESAAMLEDTRRLTAAVDDFVKEMKKHIGDDPADFWKRGDDPTA